jgi:Protein of unknown function (DUF2865)
MRNRSKKTLALAAVTASLALTSAAPAQAGDFFSALFGAFGVHRPQAPSPSALPFTSEGDPVAPQAEFRPRASYGGGGQAYCVRTCDGRYFPISGPDNASRTTMCNSFCPASETKVVYGGNIDNAATDAGKRYSELPNAFRYRNEVVAGCTCNGKDQFGLASVSIEKDPTLRQGDIVAGNGGLMVAGRTADRRGAALNFSPVSPAMRVSLGRVAVMAAE